MKTNQSTQKIIFVCFLLIFNFGCNKVDSITPQSSGLCKKIIISEDGDETEYGFDSQGRLLKLFGASTADYFKNNSIKINMQDYYVALSTDGAAINANDLSFVSDFVLKKINGETKATYGEAGGYINGAKLSFTGEKANYTYDNNGNCTSINSKLYIGDKQVFVRQSTNSFFANKVSPFWNNAFQVFIESGWSIGGHTNKYLSESERYTLTSVNDDNYSVKITGTKLYSNSYDGAGRLSRIQIDTEEINRTTEIATNKTNTTTKRFNKVVTFVYAC
jgi:hypothetical protein